MRPRQCRGQSLVEYVLVVVVIVSALLGRWGAAAPAAHQLANALQDFWRALARIVALL